MKSLPTLDAIDKQILRELQLDGRASYAAMSQKVGLTPPAVRARVQRLRATGVLQIAAITDPIQLGYQESAFVMIRVEGDLQRVADEVGAIPNVVYMVKAMGGYDLVAEVVCFDRAEFNEVINVRLRSIDGVRSIDTFPYSEIHTHRFTWGVPD